MQRLAQKKWTLQQTLAEMQILEDNSMQAKAMGQQETNSLSKVSRRKKETKKASQYERTKEGVRTCKYRGGTHPLQNYLCPAYAKILQQMWKSQPFFGILLVS